MIGVTRVLGNGRSNGPDVRGTDGLDIRGAVVLGIEGTEGLVMGVTKVLGIGGTVCASHANRLQDVVKCWHCLDLV